MTTDELLEVAHCMSPHEAVREALPLLKKEQQTVKDLAMLVRRLCFALRNNEKSAKLRAQAGEYLHIRGLVSSVTREELAQDA